MENITFNTQLIKLGAVNWNLKASKTSKTVRRTYFLQNKEIRPPIPIHISELVGSWSVL
jgi:hypothetical protein